MGARAADRSSCPRPTPQQFPFPPLSPILVAVTWAGSQPMPIAMRSRAAALPPGNIYCWLFSGVVEKDEGYVAGTLAKLTRQPD